MRIPQSGLRLDNPAWPLLQAQITYWSITDSDGSVLGTTLADSRCSTAGLQPSYAGQTIKILSGPSAGQVRPIAIHDLATGIITVAAAWTDETGGPEQIVASTRFVILSSGGGGGGPPPPPTPGVGLWMFGMCDPGMTASTTTLVLTNLAGFNDDLFNNEFWIQVIHNANSAGNPPEREIRRITNYVNTGTFTTDVFSVNVEANDLVCVFHESIMAIEIMGYGTLDTDSVTIPADSTRAGLYSWENDNYFNGCLLIPTEGVCRLQPRRIIDYTRTGGLFNLDPNYPFSQAPGTVDYIIVGDQCGYSWPYIQALMNILESPQVDQNSIEVARLSIHNLRPDDAVIPVTEYASTIINIDRYRPGVDAAWVNIVTDVAMTEAAGYATYPYTFPSASWQDGDLVRYTISGCALIIPAAATGATFYVPAQIKTTCVGGLLSLIKKVNLIFDVVNSVLKLTETGNTLTADGTEQIIYQNETPMGVYEPRKVKIDCVNMIWGDKLTIRWYERIESSGTIRLKDKLQVEDFQDSPIKNIELEPNRFGVKVTIQQTVGTYRSYNWEVLYKV